jgi:hypothetical protein
VRLAVYLREDNGNERKLLDDQIYFDPRASKYSQLRYLLDILVNRLDNKIKLTEDQVRERFKKIFE